MVKPKNSMHNHVCINCKNGRFQLRKINQHSKTPKIVIKNIWVEVCDKCGEMLFGPATCREIERQIKKKYPDYYQQRKTNKKE